MAGPIGHGISEAMRKARTPRAAPPPTWGGSWLRFVVITAALSWLTAGVLGPPRTADAPLVRLFWASLYYAAIMGWPPLVGAWIARAAHRNATPAPGLRPARLADAAMAIGLAAGLATVAMLLARVLGEPAGSAAVDPRADMAAAAAGAFVVLVIQAGTEEYGWRGFPLSCAIEQWGPRAGLAIHGLAWGAWYAPLFLVTAADPRAWLAAAAPFVVTCLFLGIVLGWLRLRSRSLLPPTLANAVLTIMAGLPLLLHDGSTGARDAVFRWPGWPALAAVALAVLVSRTGHGAWPNAPSR
jgi:membrane protease YdiL (CAAX protease family)